MKLPKGYKKAFEEHKCEGGFCEWCEEKHECLFWHNVTVHNMPYGWQYYGAEYDKEMDIHLGCLWKQILQAFSGEWDIATINNHYLAEFAKFRSSV